MKLIHLSDLHIGKRIGEVSLIDDQRHILTQIAGIIRGERPDAVMIAGDVYDKSVPPAEAVTLLDEFLCAVAGQGFPILMMSGNHDSAERLAFGARLMAGAGVHVSPVYSGKAECVTLRDEFGEVRIHMLPFVKPIHIRKAHPDAQIESYTDAVARAIAEMEIDTGVRNVLMTHQFVTGAATCESEEISVGGTDGVDAGVFADFDYVALGHLHGPQNIGGNRIRYCGTPLKYSFSEMRHKKSVTVVHMGAKGDVHLEAIPLEPMRDMREIRGTFAELMAGDGGAGGSKEDYLRIVLTDEQDVMDAAARLRAVYPNMLELRYDNARTRESRAAGMADRVSSRTPLELFAELYERQNNAPMSEAQAQRMRQIIEDAQEDEHETA